MEKIIFMLLLMSLKQGYSKITDLKVSKKQIPLQLPAFEITLLGSSEKGTNLSLIYQKTDSITGKGRKLEKPVGKGKMKVIVPELDFGAVYRFSLMTNKTEDGAMVKTMSTDKAPCAVPDTSSTIKVLMVHHENASHYDLVVRHMTNNMNHSQLPAPKSIPSTNLSYNENQTVYIAIRVKTLNTNGTVFVVGDDNVYEGYRNVPLKSNTQYSFFQRSHLKNNNTISFHWMPILRTLNGTLNRTLNGTLDPNSGAINNGTKKADGDLDGDEIAFITIGVAIALIALIFCIICCCHYKFSLKYAPKPQKKAGKNAAIHRLNTDPRIPVTDSDFYDHVAQMKFHNFKGFYDEFSQMTIDFKSAEEFRLETNVIKNRFANVPCYDHSRVKLDGEYQDYIHANYVPGALSDRDYILTQSPLVETVNDFWKMVWQHNAVTVVMMGEFIEKGNTVCSLYFPDSANPEKKAFVELSLVKEYITAHFAVRTISMTNGEETRTVNHFQFLGWPPVQVTPPCSTSFLHFLQSIKNSRKSQPNGPIIVHGTTGTGRAGIFASVDSQIKRVVKQGDINVYDSVQSVRENRHDGIKTLDEYIFIHESILEFILKRNIHDIPVQYLPKYIENAAKIPNEQPFKVEYNFLASTVVTSTQKMSAANQPCNKHKNRYENVKPFDDNRVILSKLINSEGSDYINASYVDTYMHKKAFIATQAPLVETLADFWRMISETQSWVIVMLGQEIENGQLKADRFWPDAGYAMALENLSVKLISTSHDVIKDVIIRQIELLNTETSETKFIQMYQYLTWPHHEKITSESILSLVQLVQQSQLWKEKLKAKSTCVVSSSGIGRPGVFIALRSLQEESENENTINIFRTVQRLRQQRASLIQKREEYILLYTSTLEITNEVRRKTIMDSTSDPKEIGLHILPDNYSITLKGSISERYNSVSQSSSL